MTLKRVLATVFLLSILNSYIISAPITEQIIVDQIGYRTTADKWFMIADPRTGYNAAVTYVPGASVELRRASDDISVMTIPVTAWNAGAEHSQSGDVVWQGNFSAYTTPGTYYIFDTTNNTQSFDFDIADDTYNTILESSVKSYYYQRCGTAITGAHGGTWTHAACHTTTQQTARLYDASLGGDQGAATARDITGGWHDAGDYRKYTSWMAVIVWDLAYAYEWNPDAFSDATGIPESNNGVPDILDEIKWELDWLLRMQGTNGALYSGAFVVTGINGTGNGIGDPSTENRQYFYANYSTAATGSGCSSFAIGARLFAPYEAAYPGYSAALQIAAENAWAYLQANPSNITYNHTGFDNANANKGVDADRGHRIMSAAELYRLTGDTDYRTYIDDHYDDPPSTGVHNPITSGYFETSGSYEIQRGLISYCLVPGATSSVVTAVKNSINQGIQNQAYGQRNNDPYKSYTWDGHHCWGSNGIKSEWGNLCVFGNKLNVNAGLSAAYLKTGEEYLHYIHGRNPNAFNYITQSQLYGADKPIKQIYHGWFHHGTVWDINPAPGILSGGPNWYFVPDASYIGTIEPPQNQPPMKSYKDWNTSWPENSWEVTENSTGYQSRYTLLASFFASAAGPTATPTYTFTYTDTITPGGPTFTFTHTPTETFTNSHTSTQTPTPVSVLFNTCDTINYNGAWTETASTISINTIETAAITQGTGALQIDVETIAAWQDGIASLGGFVPSDWSGIARIEMDVYIAPGEEPWGAADTYHQLVLVVDSNDTSKWYRTITANQNITTGMNHLVFTINWALDLDPDPILPIDAISNLTFIINSETGNTGTLYFDNMILYSTASPETPTATITLTPVISATATATVTMTEVLSATATLTATATVTMTEVFSLTITKTPTATVTVTQDISSTSTPTATATGTSTVEVSATSTQTATPTATHTEELSATVTNTITVTITITSSLTFTATPTITLTPVISATNTVTRTITITSFTSPTPTVTPSITATFTRTITVTVTPTVTNIINTLTPTVTLTPAIQEGDKQEITDVFIYPHPFNPESDEMKMFIRYKLSKSTGLVKLRLYSSAFRLISETEISQNCTPGINTGSVNRGKLKNLSTGTYYFVLTTDNGEGEIKSKVDKLIIMK
ncbi:MAG: hypothetical protein CVV21_07590 [Candidatus Goldiibacteriota bacterium HGW-Goldbacteria-1]|nr:MAG: hypothetical protein CVV21_07590 [Candidatus Goldiibacteriota bacterium HGW-Goldbacteria-1]